MAGSPLFGTRALNLCYWNAEARVVDAERLALEVHLKRLGDVRVQQVKTLDAPETAAADLLIVAAQAIPTEEFPKWLAGLRRRVVAHGAIWTPALILADVTFDTLSDIWADVTRDNWYFDILAPSHVASIPIRVANLLRIHDHLHELKRYESALDDINAKVKVLEGQMARVSAQALSPASSSPKKGGS
jgi:hypothetical protein